MPLELRRVVSATEVPELTTCLLAAFKGTRSNFIHIAAPINGTGPGAFEDRVKSLSTRHWFAHSLDRTSHWFKVVDTDSKDRVIAGARWNVYTEDPFKGEQHEPKAYWIPEGPERRYADIILGKLHKIRGTRRQPHIFLVHSFTHPSYRRRGAGHLLMEWATRKADDLGLEIFLEASPLGSLLYSSHGFRIIGGANLLPESNQAEDNEAWRRINEATDPLRCAIMKRPIGGKWESPKQMSVGFDLQTNVWLGSFEAGGSF